MVVSRGCRRLAPLHSSSLAVTHVTVLTTKGPIRGEETPLHGGMTSIRFLGIPYAKPPLGHLRFQNPISTDEWTHVITLTNPRSPCIALDHQTNCINGDEDCLYLDIHTGKTTSGVESLESNEWPVFVAFHGVSSLKVHPPQWLFQHVVLVVVYYRLQILGHLTAEKVENPPGVMDQIMALEWIHQNIMSFGGNPDQVSIIGEGQTGNDVFALLFTPLAEGLFTGAGIVSAPLGLTMTSTDIAAAIRVLASRVDCPHSMQEAIKCLKKKKAHDLIRQQPFNIFAPVWAKNFTCFSHVPLVIGLGYKDGGDYVKYGEEVLKFVVRNYDGLKDGVEAFYGNKSINSEVIFDSVFYAPAIEWAKTHAQHAPTFFYELQYEHPLTTFQMIFDGSDTTQSVDEHVIRANVLALWSNFVIKGQPSTSDLPSWAPFSSSSPNCYEIDVESKSPSTCRRINQASFWKALHVFDVSIANVPINSTINARSQPKNHESSTGCAVAVTILTLICIFLFTVCLCVRHPQFHLHLATTFQNFISRICAFRAPLRPPRGVPQTEV